MRVGRVQKVELDQTLARVSFIVQQGQPILTDTIASITYQNIVGQRYLALAPAAPAAASRYRRVVSFR
ncbi:mce related family protein [Mycobacterium ulcerans str. Harvey]|uniref:Mce related family protein n=1 Tax=Mycobacterium ulcerans str. Harvey TaxID=1299332 RepID=A0ABN0QLM3_MYCUL|nr:mce related family protein [Mycobacterium ulcerans str. Harvey]